jgi:hypothetical protein
MTTPLAVNIDAAAAGLPLDHYPSRVVGADRPHDLIGGPWTVKTIGPVIGGSDGRPALTTVRQDFNDFGARAFTLLASSIESGHPSNSSTGKPQLVVRDSSAAVG